MTNEELFMLESIRRFQLCLLFGYREQCCRGYDAWVPGVVEGAVPATMRRDRARVVIT
jgi:hypothetical protein